jgi:hypothetical protein
MPTSRFVPTDPIYLYVQCLNHVHCSFWCLKLPQSQIKSPHSPNPNRLWWNGVGDAGMCRTINNSGLSMSDCLSNQKPGLSHLGWALCCFYATRKGGRSPVKMIYCTKIYHTGVPKWGMYPSEQPTYSYWSSGNSSLHETQDHDSRIWNNSCPIESIENIKSQAIRVCPLQWDITTRRNAIHALLYLKRHYPGIFCVYNTHICIYIYICNTYIYI